MSLVISGGYLVAAVLLILGLRGMSSPRTAHPGLIWVGVGMVLAVAVTFLETGTRNLGLMLMALVLGGALAAVPPPPSRRWRWPARAPSSAPPWCSVSWVP